eukprot:5099576-Amphidinium_carterae.1
MCATQRAGAFSVSEVQGHSRLKESISSMPVCAAIACLKCMSSKDLFDLLLLVKRPIKNIHTQICIKTDAESSAI